MEEGREGKKVKAVREILCSEFIQEYANQRQAARALGISQSAVCIMAQRGEKLLIAEYSDGDWEYLGKKSIYKGETTCTQESNYSGQEQEKPHQPNVVVSPPNAKESTTQQLKQESKIEELEAKCKNLGTELNKAKKERLETSEVRQYILGLTEHPVAPAGWLIDQPSPGKASDNVVGVPSLMVSDIHAGEVVRPGQVFGKNQYNMAVMRRRIKELTRRTVNMLTKHMVAPAGYPGIVIDLAGDLISGDIHDELTATNDLPTLPCVLELLSELTAMLESFAAVFGRVMVFSVPGNHGRTTQKIQAKNFAYTNYDWLISCLLEKQFAKDDRVQFCVSDQPDLQYQIYDHRYRLTHGNQFRGGQGFIGALAPIARGDKKKRTSAASYGMDYDTLLVAHYHQLWMMGSVIGNGSVIGFNEFAINNNFTFEVPRQALWITHPQYGVTYTMPVLCEEPRPDTVSGEWVKWYQAC